MADMSERVCLNHPNTPAVARCETCFKPLCEDCIVLQEGKTFCTDTCAQNFSQSGERIAEFDKNQRKARLRKRIRKLVTLAILAALGWGVYQWCRSHPNQAKSIWRKIRGATEQVR